MIWLAFGIGLVVGCAAGMLVIGLCLAAGSEIYDGNTD